MIAYVVKCPLAKVTIQFTPGKGKLPLRDAVTASKGCVAAMNGGAGFDYAGTKYGIPHLKGFEKVRGIPYTRRLIFSGVVNQELSDNPNRGPWSILGFDAQNVYLIVTVGIEPNGMTQLEAAEYIKSIGVTDGYLEDSGHSSQIAENGTILYWPYGPTERVPQFIGLKEKRISGVSRNPLRIAQKPQSVNKTTVSSHL